MSKTMSRGPTRNKNYLGLMSIFFTLLISAMFFYPQSAKAAMTPAGVTITNQASATYDDGTNTFTSFSGNVDTKVQSVYGILVTPDGSADGTTIATTLKQSAVPGTTVYYQYTVKNTGNDNDNYTFTTAEIPAGFTASSIKIYWDKDGNGSAGAGDPELTPGVSSIGPIPADGTEKVVIQIIVPSTGVSANQADSVNLLGTSTHDALQTDTDNFNRTTITNDAVITVVKSMSLSTASPGDTITYTLDVKNTGLASATNIVITDNIPANTAFVIGSASGTSVDYNNNLTTPAWSATTPTANPGGQAVVSTDVKQVRFTHAGPLIATGNIILTFDVKIAPYVAGGIPAPNTNIDNTASFSYDKSVAPKNVGPLNSNTVTTIINKKSAVKITPNTTPFTTQTASGSDIGVFPTLPTDTVATASSGTGVASAGSAVYFRETVTNNGNATDTFTISLDSSISLPANWAVTFLQETDPGVAANNTSSLTSNSTGPLTPGASMNLVVRVFIPANPGVVPTVGTPQNIRIAATSTNGGTNYKTDFPDRAVDYTLDSIPAISLPSVELRNRVADLVTPLVITANSYTESANGATVSFPLNIKNTGGTNDTFNLSALTPGFGVVFYPIDTNTTVATAGVVNDTFIDVVSTSGIIAGDTIAVAGQTFTVQSIGTNIATSKPMITFASGQKLANVVPLNTALVKIIMSAMVATNSLAPGTFQDVLAVVSVPTNTLATTSPHASVTFTATSNLNSVGTQSVPDTIIIPPFKTFTLVSDRTGTSPKGGTIIYTHILTNTGNTTETFDLSSIGGGFNYLFLDNTAPNPLPLVSLTGISVTPGQAYTFKLRVSVPANTPVNTIDTVKVKATESTAGFLENTDTTTVVDGFLSLTKSGVTIDKNSVTPYGAGNPATGGSVKAGTSGANKAAPEDIIEYTITYINNGTVNANNTIITDSIPANTTYIVGSLKIGVTTKTDTLADDTADSLTTEAGNTANPAPRGSVVFRVDSGAGTPIAATATTGGTVVSGGGTGSVTFRVKVN